MKFLALGDSYTIGEGVGRDLRWPNQLTSLLNAQGYEVEQPQIIATTGWRTDNLINAIKIAQLKSIYDLVSVLIGVNNQYQGKSINEFKIDFEELLRISIALAKGNKNRLFVVSIPDYGYTPFGLSNKDKISKQLSEFNNSINQVCEANEVTFINITDLSREGLTDSSLVASDGLHPSGKMYKQWADRISDQLIKML